jgi:hypothetical protein
MFQVKNTKQSTNNNRPQISIDTSGLPKELQQQYSDAATIAITLATLDTSLTQRLGASKVFIIPVKSLKDAEDYLKSLKLPGNPELAVSKMLKNFQGDAITVSYGTKDNLIHFTFVEANTFQKRGKLAVTLNHELQHVALIKEGQQGKTPKEDEIKAFTASNLSIQKIISQTQQVLSKTKDEKAKNLLSRLIDEMKEGLAEDRKTLDKIKKSN